MKNHKVILIIMDGWGLAENPQVSAIEAAQTPFYDYALKNYPFTRLEASGLAVGLPEGQMGNSEVGHMNIGAGRIVYQDLVRINRELEGDGFSNNPQFQKILNYCHEKGKNLHLLGLLSDGGVHSSIHHLKGILRLLGQAGLPGVYIHAFTDGRDTAPTGGRNYIADLEAACKEYGTGKIASIIGRYYAMDRDKRWERIKLAYDLLVHGKGENYETAGDAIESAYGRDITDEFIPACSIRENGQAVATIAEGDAVLFFNFRTDRGRQLTDVLTQTNMPAEGMEIMDLHYTTMTRYDESFQGIHVLYEKEGIQNGLGDYLQSQGRSQIRIAETEKYPHVTFFFNGGREKAHSGESYIICPSPKVATYDLQPEMSAADIRDTIISALKTDKPDFVCLNFANPDMVGHTGVFEAAVKACEVVDQCTKAVTETALAEGYKVLITADHGNADCMANSDGSMHTAHTTALVPLFLIDPEGRYGLRSEVGKLGDLAPTILELMHLPQPEEMTGNSLLKS